MCGQRVLSAVVEQITKSSQLKFDSIAIKNNAQQKLF